MLLLYNGSRKIIPMLDNLSDSFFSILQAADAVVVSGLAA